MRLFPSLPVAPRRRQLARWTRVVFALAGVLLLAGCNWWRMDGHQSTIMVEGPVARAQRDLFYVTCWVTFIIFILVGSVLAYATLKFRARSETEEHAEPPPQGHGNPLVELGLIGASVLALVVIAIPTLKNIWYTYDVPGAVNRDKFDEMVRKGQAYEINATAYQWWFRFEYPSEQINGVGPLVTGNELVVPAGRPVRINLRTVDVIHSFWVPKLAGKVDMIPGRANFLWFEAEKPGYFWGQCAEYCGDSHAVMRFRVIALGPREYNNWLDQQLQPARNVAAAANANTPKAQFASLRAPDSFGPNEKGITEKYEIEPLQAWIAQQEPDVKNEDAALIAKGKQLFTAKTCINCHTIRGHAGAGVAGPDLTHVGARTTVAAGLLENNPEQLRRWIHNPGAVKPGNKMAKGYVDQKITLSPDDENALVAYLSSLK
jgi:cytochrome c oxidase subunit 2